MWKFCPYFGQHCICSKRDFNILPNNFGSSEDNFLIFYVFFTLTFYTFHTEYFARPHFKCTAKHSRQNIFKVVSFPTIYMGVAFLLLKKG